MEVHIDADIGRWILEFLFRLPIDDRLVNSLISILPLTSNNPSLKKSLLLRKLESEVSKGSISETVLDLIQQICEVDLQAGITEHSESTKAAYLAAAVECTVKFLSDSGRENKIEYFNAVKRIWKERVCKLGKAEGTGLISEALWSWKDDIEAAVWEDSARDIVLKKSEGIDAIQAVWVYVKEEKGKMGPSFLESLVEALRVDEQLRVLLGNCDKVRDKEMNLQGDNQNAGPSHEKREVHKDNVLSRRKQIASKHSKGAPAGMNRGVKIADVDTSDGDEPNKKCDLLTTLNVNRAFEALQSSPFKPQAAVEDHPSDSFHIAEKAASDMSRKNVSNESMEEGNPRADPPVAQGSQATQDNGDNMPDHSNRPQSNGSKTGLIAQNVIDPTLEEDSKDDILLDSQDEGGSGLHLRSQKRKLVSPPKVYEHHKVSKRRKPRRWSLLEEDTLKTGVETFGKGNWKLILSAYRDIFEERTEVDLKDKWRNLTRY